MLDPDATFSMVFDTPGIYQYFCKPHGSAGGRGMSAKIVVDDPEATQEIMAPGPATIAPPPRDPNPPDYVPDH
jgi:Copper binding proteins, plastocyanin/azurin family